MISFIIFMALCFDFSSKSRLFAIFTIHFIGSMTGIGFKPSLIIRTFEYLEIFLIFTLVISEISFNVFGVSSSLHAKYIEADNNPSVDLPRTIPCDDAFLNK